MYQMNKDKELKRTWKRNFKKKKKKKRNTTLRRNTNEMKALNMKLTKPKTFRGEMSF